MMVYRWRLANLKLQCQAFWYFTCTNSFMNPNNFLVELLFKTAVYFIVQNIVVPRCTGKERLKKSGSIHSEVWHCYFFGAGNLAKQNLLQLWKHSAQKSFSSEHIQLRNHSALNTFSSENIQHWTHSAEKVFSSENIQQRKYSALNTFSRESIQLWKHSAEKAFVLKAFSCETFGSEIIQLWKHSAE